METQTSRNEVSATNVALKSQAEDMAVPGRNEVVGMTEIVGEIGMNTAVNDETVRTE